MADPRGKYQAHVEDCLDDDEAVLAAARKSPGGANVKAKRSNEMGPEKPRAPERPAPSAASDSGYSSHTAATMSSADSAPSQPSQRSPPQPVDAPTPPPQSPAAPRRRRPTVTNRRKSSKSSSKTSIKNDPESPRKPLQRTASSRHRPKVEQPEVEQCTNPNCTKCPPPSTSRARRPSAVDSALDLNYTPSDQRTQYSDPNTYTPRSSTYIRQQPPSYLRGSVLLQPETSQRSRSMSRPRPARPQSFHAGSSSGQWAPNIQQPYPPTQQVHGPPLSSSAQWNMNPPPVPQQYSSVLGATPPTKNYFPHGQPIHSSPQYDHPRPALQGRTASQQPQQYNARAPALQQKPMVITHQDIDPQYSARFQTAPQSAREPRFPAYEPADAAYSEESSGEEPFIDSRAAGQRRPNNRRAATTEAFDGRHVQSLALPDRTRDREQRFSGVSSAVPSRSGSVARRPPLLNHNARTYNPPDSPRVYVESSKNRRQSYMGHELDYELEDKHRSAVYYEEAAPSRRRRADTGHRRDYGNDYDAKLHRAQEEAEGYQQKTRGADTTLTEQALAKAARRSSRAASGNSETASSRSRHSETRTSVTHGNNGELRLRVDARGPIRLDLGGEERTISINPAEDGMADIVIGGPETHYHSERGSMYGASGRKAITDRRAGEELSINSKRSSRSGREGEERRPLRRRDKPDYHR